MKVCPQCQNTYTDNSLQFCLQDGTPLVSANTSQLLTNGWTETETVISRAPIGTRSGSQIHSTQNPQTPDWLIAGTPIAQPPPRQKSNTFRVLVLTFLGLLLFFGIVGIGTWILITNMQRESANIAANRALNNANKLNNSNNKTINTNQAANVNKSPTATPSPKATLKPEDVAKAKSDITDTINGWKSASENLDLNSHMSYYADSVDYYKSGKVDTAKVRADKQKAFDIYSSININISNINTTFDASGQKASVVFDKEWTFEGSDKSNAGKVQQQLQLAKIGGKWLITGEKDLRVYYVNK